VSGKRPARLGELVGPFLEKKGLTRRLDLAGAVERWSEAVGPQVAAATRAEAVTADGVLWVRVVSSAWANELSLMAPRILLRLNEGREGRIRELRCRVGRIPGRQPLSRG
jgi:predicted nucleic acid-binding Zn ribbon protein